MRIFLYAAFEQSECTDVHESYIYKYFDFNIDDMRNIFFLNKEHGFILSSLLLGISYLIRPVAVIYMIAFGMIELFKEEKCDRKLKKQVLV